MHNMSVVSGTLDAVSIYQSSGRDFMRIVIKSGSPAVYISAITDAKWHMEQFRNAEQGSRIVAEGRLECQRAKDGRQVFGLAKLSSLYAADFGDFTRSTISGRVATQPRVYSDGRRYAYFKVVCTRSYIKDGEWKKQVSFLPVRAYGEALKTAMKIKKGIQVWVSGSILGTSYPGRKGREYVLEVVADLIAPAGTGIWHGAVIPEEEETPNIAAQTPDSRSAEEAGSKPVQPEDVKMQEDGSNKENPKEKAATKKEKSRKEERKKEKQEKDEKKEEAGKEQETEEAVDDGLLHSFKGLPDFPSYSGGVPFQFQFRRETTLPDENPGEEEAGEEGEDDYELPF